MQKTRANLHDLLVEILGSENVYFQPPESIKMRYPCIVYSLSDMEAENADNIKYLKIKKYMVTYVHVNPDSDIPDKLFELLHCVYNRHYVSDNLNHDVFDLYW